MNGGVGDSGGVGIEGDVVGSEVDGEGVKGHAGQEQLAADIAVDSRGVCRTGMGERVKNNGVRDCVRRNRDEGLVGLTDTPSASFAFPDRGSCRPRWVNCGSALGWRFNL
jgi:hypothetical protein